MHVMERLDNPSSLGDGIAVAFVATVYGVGLANLVLLPVAGRLRLRLENHLALLELSVEAALAISEGDPPSTVENRLTGILESEEISGGRLRRAA
jgi:chemotaxis protein MotA